MDRATGASSHNTGNSSSGSSPKIVIGFDAEGEIVSNRNALQKVTREMLFSQFSVSVSNWKDVSQIEKDDLWSTLKTKFEIDDIHKDTVLAMMGNQLKQYRNRIRKSELGNCSAAEIRAKRDHPPCGIPLAHWNEFIEREASEGKMQEKGRNAENRGRLESNHCLGKKSYAQLRAELGSQGVECDRAKLFELARTQPSGEITPSALGSVTRVLAEYIAQEEMDRKHGFWWSLDSRFITFTEVDSSDIPLFRIMHQGKSSVGSEAQEDHAYPFAGSPNVKLRLGVVSAIGGDIIWMNLSCGDQNQHFNDEEYLARVDWMRENILIAQVLNRAQSQLKVLKFDIETGERKVLLVEENNTWINMHDLFTPLDKVTSRFAGGFIWASEKTGYRHLYLHDVNGSCLGPITEGEWMVEHISSVDEAAGIVYFTGTFDSPLESHLYCTSLFPDWSHSLNVPRRITQGKGKHVVVLDHKLQNFVDIHDSLDSPPRVLLCSLSDGSSIMALYEQPLASTKLERLQLEPPEIVHLQANDGTTLFGALYKPDEAKFGHPPYKTMVSVYGGPSVQLVSDSWINTVDMRAQFLRNKGILVWKVDNRGSARRGLKFEGAVKHSFGRVDVEDQVTGVEWLVKQGLAKPGNVGIYGWSYGGYLSAMALARFPNVFRCAIAGAPVTSWDGYDTFYTEKYMGLPSENQTGYGYGSVMTHVSNLDGKLLLVHGMIDENVHFRHTARLVNALVAARKFYELLIFPDERHMPRRLRDRIYMEERIWEFIARNL